MGLRMHAPLFVVLIVTVCLAQVVMGTESSQSQWPATLLGHTVMASGRWAPEPRTRFEKLQPTMAPSAQTHLAAPHEDRHSYFAEGHVVGHHPADSEGAQRELLSNHFGDAALNIPPVPRADSQPCGGQRLKPCTEPVLVQPPIAAPHPFSPEFPTPPIPELPLATPRKSRDNDPMLVRVPSAPMGDLNVANTDKEIKKVIAKLDNRAAWLSAQKHWLVKATEAAAAVSREIGSAKHTKAAIASDLEQLQMAQDALSVRLKANQLKWSFKDKKMTLEQLHEQLKELKHTKAGVVHAMRDARDDVDLLKTTLGPQVHISSAELEDPIKFLDDIRPEENFNV